MQTKTIGIALIVLGALMIGYTGFNYVTTQKVIDIGPIEINKEKEHLVHWSPIVGGILMVGGIVMMINNKK